MCENVAQSTIELACAFVCGENGQLDPPQTRCFGCHFKALHQSRPQSLSRVFWEQLDLIEIQPAVDLAERHKPLCEQQVKEALFAHLGSLQTLPAAAVHLLVVVAEVGCDASQAEIVVLQ